MKTRERLKQIKKSTSWGARLFLAHDRIPGTKHDEEIMDIHVWLMAPNDPEARHKLAGLGMQMARAVSARKSAWFREWADAIDEWRKHKPHPDKLRAAIMSYALFHSNASPGKPMPDRTFQMKAIIDYLKTTKVGVNNNTPRVVYRICDELGIAIKGEPGKPKTTAK